MSLRQKALSGQNESLTRKRSRSTDADVVDINSENLSPDSKRSRLSLAVTSLINNDEKWIVKTSGGAPPLLNEDSRAMDDQEAKRIYFYGNSELRFFDATIMQFVDLTDELELMNTDAIVPEKPKQCRLPHLTDPGMTFLRMDGLNRRFLVLFGGYDVKKKTASSKIIFIDPDQKLWWYVKVDGGPVGPRINPAIVGLDGKIYIFAGFTHYSGPQRRNIKSYSIAKYNPNGWNWEACDIPYSSSLPVFQESIVVRGSQSQILLTPGRTRLNDYFKFSKNTLCFFNSDQKSFQVIDAIGNPTLLPRNLAYYYVYPYEAAPVPQPPQNENETNSRPVIQIIICGWMSAPNDKSLLLPEIWNFSINEAQATAKCLGTSNRVKELKDFDFQRFAVLGTRMILMGGSIDHKHKNELEEVAVLCDRYVEVNM